MAGGERRIWQLSELPGIKFSSHFKPQTKSIDVRLLWEAEAEVETGVLRPGRCEIPPLPSQ